ncbi:hypothetical protein HAZT_HAZT005718 [Hyalella azteca]|nr:hypothetical protein HAZT_HAZT005718 [Hyalella azteca]
MKFQFCWGTDCPDWLLAEIAALSTLTSTKLQLLVAHVADTILGEPLDPEKVVKYTGQDNTNASSLAADARVGGIRYILLSAVGAEVSCPVLDAELQQLGLSVEHAAAFIKVYEEKQATILTKLRLRERINCCSRNFRSSVTVKGVEVAGEIEPIAVLSFQAADDVATVHLNTGPRTRTTVHLTTVDVHVLIQQLNEARRIMKSLQS